MKSLKATTKKQLVLATIASILLVIVISIGIVALVQYSNRNDGVAARVYGQPLMITDVVERQNQVIYFLKSSGQTVDETSPSLYTNARSELILQELVEKYAADNGIVVEDSDVQALYDSRVAAAGDESSLLARLNQLYGTDKNSYLNTLRTDILKERVQEKIGRPLNDWYQELIADPEVVELF